MKMNTITRLILRSSIQHIEFFKSITPLDTSIRNIFFEYLHIQINFRNMNHNRIIRYGIRTTKDHE